MYVDRLPPCNHACPAGENIQAWLYEAEEGGEGYERAWRKIIEDNPFPAIMGRVCYHPCETSCNRGAARRGRRHQLGRALPRRRGDQAGLVVRSSRRADRQAGADRRRRALRALRGVPPAPPRPRGDDPRGRPDGRRHDALRHPHVPAAARRARRRGRSGSSPWASTLELNRKVTNILEAMQRGRLRRRLPRGRRPHRQARLHPGRARPRASSTPCRCFAAWRARRSRCWAGASSSTAAATPRWTPPAPPSGSAPPTPSSSTGAPASGCRPTSSRSPRPRRRA